MPVGQTMNGVGGGKVGLIHDLLGLYEFHELLKARCAAHRALTLPERERAALDALLKEVGHNPAHESSHQVYSRHG